MIPIRCEMRKKRNTSRADETFTRPSSLLNEHGRSKNKGPFQYGYLEGSYEIDTLELD